MAPPPSANAPNPANRHPPPLFLAAGHHHFISSMALSHQKHMDRQKNLLPCKSPCASENPPQAPSHGLRAASSRLAWPGPRNSTRGANIPHDPVPCSAAPGATAVPRLSFHSSASLSVAGVLLFESTTFSNFPKPTPPRVKTFKATGATGSPSILRLPATRPAGILLAWR